MRISSIKPILPCIYKASPREAFQCCTVTHMKISNQLSVQETAPKNWENLVFNSLARDSTGIRLSPVLAPAGINRKWMEYQGVQNWEGLLDPLDDNLRREIIRYGHFVEAAYRSFDFDPSSSSYAMCRYPKSSLLDRSGFPNTGYRITRNLRATSGVQVPRLIEKAPSWVANRSSWIGYVAVCHDKDEIARLGRQDVVIAFRGTATCLEWFENLRATLTDIPDSTGSADGSPMVESGFLSLYTSSTATCPSLQEQVRDEIRRILQSNGDRPISFTLTGHSLGAALATLAAHDIKTVFERTPLVTVISFGGPRVGNRSFRHRLENHGTKVLRIVNSDDLITKLPGFVIDENEDLIDDTGDGIISSWLQKRMEDMQWAYADVGCELRLRSRDSSFLKGINFATCHELKTYLHLVDGFVSSTSPFRATARRIMKGDMVSTTTPNTQTNSSIFRTRTYNTNHPANTGRECT